MKELTRRLFHKPTNIIVFLLKDSPCPKCKQNHIVLEKLESELINEHIDWFFCNIEDYPEIAQTYNVNSGGTIVIIKGSNIKTITSTATPNILKKHIL